VDPTSPEEAAGHELVVEVTGTAQRRAWLDRTMPPVEEVRPGLWSIPVPLPMVALRYVLVYAFELPDGLGLVDAGWDGDEAWDALVTGLRTAGADVADVRGVVVTHVHPDHHGLAARLNETAGAWIGMHAEEAATLPVRLGEVEEILEGSRADLRRLGAPEDEVGRTAVTAGQLRYLRRLAEPDRTIADGERIPFKGWDLRAVHTPGHTPGHLCVYDEEHRLLFSGDHVLPRISPNISAQWGQLPDPLGVFLGTFDRLRGLDVDEVLPAHEFRFAGLPARLDDLERHHAARLEELLAAVEAHPGESPWDLAPRLTWSRPWPEITQMMRRAAVTETLAHLRRLEVLGRARVEPGAPERWYALGPAQ
jgi:glyoxylase-like metal-dependent hydrolase (beta-lactamase superfamily II)